MCKCEHGMDEYSRDLLDANIRLYTTISDLKKEIAELKKKLNINTTPPKGAPLKERSTGQIGYFTGIISNGCIWVTNTMDITDSNRISFHDCDEIEVKVKGA